MKAGTVAALTLATMVVSTTHAQSQEKRESAFGFYKGMTLKEAQAAAPLKRSSFSPASYSTESPPKPVFPFASYQVIIGPLSGVCAVIASTDLSPIGSKEAKGTSETVFRLLEKRYGPHTGTNLELGIIGWEDAQGPGTRIELRSQEYDGRIAMAVTYHFSNREKCIEETHEGL